MSQVGFELVSRIKLQTSWTQVSIKSQVGVEGQVRTKGQGRVKSQAGVESDARIKNNWIQVREKSHIAVELSQSHQSS